MFKILLSFISVVCLLLLIEQRLLLAVDAAPSMVMPGCQYMCGNVSIPYPFGIGSKNKCFHSDWFEITCNASSNPHRPFLHKLKLEVLNISMGYRRTLITLNSPIVSHCPEQTTSSSTMWNSTSLTGSPFNFSTLNLLTVVGCGGALLTYDGEIIAGCTSACRSDTTTKDCYGINCCQSSIPDYLFGLDSYGITIGGNTTGNCTYAFLRTSPLQILDTFSTPYAISETDHVPVSINWAMPGDPADAFPSMVLPGCENMCGNVSIPYPFGIGNKCYLDEWYEVTCNASANPPQPFLHKLNLEILDISIDYNDASITLNSPIVSHCPEQGKSSSTIWNSTISGTPFYISTKNLLTVVGCDNALLTYDGRNIAGCTSACLSTTNMQGCYGINCCQTSIPVDNLDSYGITISGNTTGNCTYALLATSTWKYEDKFPKPYIIYVAEYFPTLTSASPGYIRDGDFRAYSCSGLQSGNDLYYVCYCQWPMYEGNPYIHNGCKIVEECANCENDCFMNNAGKYYCHHGNKTQIILASSLGGGLLLLLLCGFCFVMIKFVKKRRLKKRKLKFFKRNGGLLLQQQILSGEGTIEKTIVFTSNELEKATDNFTVNRVIGQGGQGTVYKGMFSDGRTVAIKKSKAVDESQLEQFINEVVILSQINHRNIVKLLGCCLETDVPFIVYEFICNGNLLELIHDQNEDFPFSWKMRLQIATEVAGAVAYLHSSSSTPIFHRDIKSTNILLDEKYRAKVSDFGTSRSIAIEQTHLTTLVNGTFGYLDPEYFQSSQFTEKSDVYSFGVVLVELLTGQKAISSLKSEEERSLATRFILSIEDMRLFDLLDARVVEGAAKEDIIVVTDIARRCLSLNGKHRPTMKQVMMELEAIRMSHMPPLDTQNSYFPNNKSIIEMKAPAFHESSSTHSGIGYQRAFSLDVDPLLSNTL